MRLALQKLAAAWCVLMAALLAVVQFTTPTPPPTVLFVIFASVWLFGAAMLWWAPTFGAIGTALYGIILGADVIAMHGFNGTNAALALGSFTGSALAIVALVQIRRARA